MSHPTAWSERCQQLALPIIDICRRTPVASGPAVLARKIAHCLPEWSFRETLCRGGWYRLGGVIGKSGSRIAEQLENWASDALAERGGDLACLLEDYAGSGLRATRFTGRTHYLVAAAPGGGSTDFLQLEIESLQETTAQALFDREPAPSTLDELIDARALPCDHGSDAGCGVPLGCGRYVFRRITHIGDCLAQMRSQALAAPPIHRFVADWDASSAGHAAALSNHFVLTLGEHLDRYRQTIRTATPVAALNGELPRFTGREGVGGLSLHRALSDFDRAVGAPLAWYFHLLAGKTSKAIPYWVPAAVLADAAQGFSYLPERDLAVVRQWLHQPYTF